MTKKEKILALAEYWKPEEICKRAKVSISYVQKVLAEKHHACKRNKVLPEYEVSCICPKCRAMHTVIMSQKPFILPRVYCEKCSHLRTQGDWVVNDADGLSEIHPLQCYTVAGLRSI